jgi:hypothetical protein
MDKLEQVAKALAGKGQPATYEYPGYLMLPVNERTYCFGFANGPLGWDVCRDDCHVFDSGESNLTDGATLEQLLAYIIETTSVPR